MSARDVVIVMTRLPCEGKNKTRLMPALGSAGATAMHDRLARHAVGWALRYAQTHAEAAVVVHLDGGSAEQGRAWLGEIDCIEQVSGDLGERMFAAVGRAFAVGAQRVVVMGSDCPTLDAGLIGQAFEALRESEVVFGPAADGGYYLIGMCASNPKLFQGIAWGSSGVLAESLRAAGECALRVALLEVRADVDLPGDIAAADALLTRSPFL